MLLGMVGLYNFTITDAIGTLNNISFLYVGRCFVEKYVDQPRHIEVQCLGDGTGNVIHLFDRDCSVQRRHQKVIECAPATGLSREKREKIFEDACHLLSMNKYRNAGTVEFLVDKDGNHYFMEVNPRVQVEHVSE